MTIPAVSAAQHRYQARRDGVDILRAYDARPGHQLEDAGPRGTVKPIVTPALPRERGMTRT
jgi:hypothetical protein